MNLSSFMGAGWASGPQLLSDNDGILLCRACREGVDGKRDIVLAVLPAAEHPTPQSLDRLTHEYHVRDELDGAWAAKPLELVQEASRTILVLEDPGGEPLSWLLGAPMEIGSFLRLAIQIATALGEVHQHGLVHKDVKPANVLVNRTSGQVRLTGFGFASRQPRERQSPAPPESIAGTLSYMAPEQTGRMNRSIDSRSDLYSLGITLYQMLTGSLPFAASDPMELVHFHLARQPVPPSERVQNIPVPVSSMVMKLLAKTAEDRYQTVAGVKRDLRRCLDEWQAHARIESLRLGEDDVPDRLLIPEQLYGRAREVETLLSSFGRIVKSGAPELVLVSGYSGIGKSSVVNELHKVLLPPRGLFASGKFDQYKRDVPYSTLVEALESLTRPLLGKSDVELAAWRDAILEALGPNARLVVDLVPELKLIVGEQPPVPELPPQQAQSRFQLVFRRFIGVFARPEHPLVLFLDDLQWLDAATLDLLADLLQQTDVQQLMLIGAYRDNEVDCSHPLMRKLAAIRQAGAKVEEIKLAPLSCDDLQQLIADSLRLDRERAAPLAQLVHRKTAGNPFFAIQFLSALAEEELLAFDHHTTRWSWDLDRIHAKGYTDNVVDLMVEKLTRLPADTQKALQQFACLGNVAEIGALTLVRGISEKAVHAELWQAARLGLIERLETSYRFAHDRVQEAAYSLIPEALRAQSHLRIGRLLAAHTPSEKQEEAIFEIVNQLNRGVDLINSREEREHLAELNLIAGKRAQAASAHASGLSYFVAAAALLTDDCWQRRHELAFEVEINRAKCEYLTGQLAAAEVRLSSLSRRAGDMVEQAAVTCLRMEVLVALDQSSRAVDVAIDYLGHVGITWSPHPSEEEARREYQQVRSELGNRTTAELVALPLMTDRACLATMDVLTTLMVPALFTDPSLYYLAASRSVSLSLARGYSDGSCPQLECLGLAAATHFGDFEGGFRLGEVGYELVERRGLKRFQAKTYVLFGAALLPWGRHVRAGRDVLRFALQAANRSGDLTYAQFSYVSLTANLLAAGDPLPEVQGVAETGFQLAQKSSTANIVDMVSAQLAFVRTLRGLTQRFGLFNHEQFEESQTEARFAAARGQASTPECMYLIRKLQARFLAGDSKSALEARAKAEPLIWTMAMFELAEYHLYAALACAANCQSAPAAEAARLMGAILAHHEQLCAWAKSCPENFDDRATLVGAEIARIEGRELDAERSYEQALRSARASGFVHTEALANELAARFYAARGFEKIAHAYLRDAHDGYLRWGADGKVRQLERLYPRLHIADDGVAAERASERVQQMDVTAVVKASQAVSSDIELPRLIETLMKIALQNAGADRGLLLLPRHNDFWVDAEGQSRGDEFSVVMRQAPVSARDCPDALLRYVVRTQKTLILDDASHPTPLCDEAYVRRRHPRSILCLPLMKQAKLTGLLYLENTLATHAFTPERVAVLELLAAQAAISLENALLYVDLQAIQLELAHANRVATMGQLTSSIAHEVNQPISAVAINADAALNWLSLTPPDVEEARLSIEQIIKDAHRSSEVIARTRALAKKTPQRKERFDLNEAIHEVVALTGGEALKSGIRVKTQLADRLSLIDGDRVQLQQVLLNLVVNAVQAMATAADATGDLLITTAATGSNLVLVRVADSGPGLDPTTLESVFDPYYTTKAEGLGMGLAICRSIIEAHDGRLWASANKPRGAVFQFTLPTNEGA